jgi:hypothetical protein
MYTKSGTIDPIIEDVAIVTDVASFAVLTSELIIKNIGKTTAPTRRTTTATMVSIIDKSKDSCSLLTPLIMWK